MLYQHLLNIIIEVGQISREITGNAAVPGVQMQLAFKVYLAFSSKQRYGQGGVPQLYLGHANVRDLKGGLIQIDRIAHPVGQGQRIVGRKVRRTDELLDSIPAPGGNGIPLAGDWLDGNLRLLLLSVGEERLGLVNDFQVQPVADSGHI